MKKYIFLFSICLLFFSVPCSAKIKPELTKTLYNELLKGNTDITFDTDYSEKDITDSIKDVIYNHPEFVTLSSDWYYYDDGISFIIEENDKDKEFEIEDMVSQYFDEIGNLSDSEIAHKVYQYLIDNTEYTKRNEEEDFSTVYKTLMDGKALCSGYAKTYKYILDYYGIPCYIITSKKDNHAWNLVQLDDKWYSVDCCSDDANGNDHLSFIDKEKITEHYANDYVVHKNTSN